MMKLNLKERLRAGWKMPLASLSRTLLITLSGTAGITGIVIASYYTNYIRDDKSKTYACIPNNFGICEMYVSRQNQKGDLKGAALTLGGIKYPIRCVKDAQIALRFETERVPFLEYVGMNEGKNEK